MTQKILSREDARRVLLETAEENGIGRGDLAQRAGMDRCTLYRDTNLNITNYLTLCKEAGLTILITDTPALVLRAAANLEI